MKITLLPDADPPQVRELERQLTGLGLRVHHLPAAGDRVLCAIASGDPVAIDRLRALPGVATVEALPHEFELASRALCPTQTRIRIGELELGGEEVLLMAGPCAVESEEQVFRVARRVHASGARVLRGGAFKPRTSPYSFQGLGVAGLKILRAAADELGMAVVSEIMDASQLDDCMRYVDILQVGARNAQNVTLLQALGRVDRPVLLKRGLASTMDEWLMSAEYVLSGGNHRVLLCERGIRTHGSYTRNTLDLAAVPVARELTHLPILVDPSHATGIRSIVGPMALAAVAAGADGLLIEVHPTPEAALCDGRQSLYPDQFDQLAARLRAVAAAVGRRIAPGPAQNESRVDTPGVDS